VASGIAIRHLLGAAGHVGNTGLAKVDGLKPHRILLPIHHRGTPAPVEIFKPDAHRRVLVQVKRWWVAEAVREIDRAVPQDSGLERCLVCAHRRRRRAARGWSGADGVTVLNPVRHLSPLDHQPLASRPRQQRSLCCVGIPTVSGLWVLLQQQVSPENSKLAKRWLRWCRQPLRCTVAVVGRVDSQCEIAVGRSAKDVPGQEPVTGESEVKAQRDVDVAIIGVAADHGAVPAPPLGSPLAHVAQWLLAIASGPVA
jgi:hypothetical protein